MIRRCLVFAALWLSVGAWAQNFSIDFHNLVTQRHERVLVRVWLPEKQAPNKPGLIYLTGCDGSTQESTGPIFAALLARGFVIAQLESFQAWGRTANACTGDAGALTGLQRAEETYRARDGLVTQGLVAEDNVALLGYSHGGWTISHAMFLDPTPNYSTQGKAPFAAAVAMYPYCQTVDSPSFINRTPTLLLGGDRDEWTHFSRCRQLARRVAAEGADRQAPLELHLYPNATHSWDRSLPRREFWAGRQLGFQVMEHNAEVTRDSVERAINWVLRFTRH
jgi:dienelactone hydrolase